jgi:hypothetical protein
MSEMTVKFMLNFLLVFAATTCADICWTKYMLEVQKKRAFLAASWSAAIIAMGAFTLISYLSDRWLLVAAILGSFTGTYFTVKKESK